jgi:excisionase family DNA binding protein
LKTAARRLGVHYQTAYRWVRSGQLVAVKVGAGYEISDAALARFQAQRTALERASESRGSRPETIAPPAAVATRESALRVLDRMIDAVGLDPRPVVERASRFAAEVLGDCAVLSLRADDADLEVAHIAHSDPIVEVHAATVARDAPFTKEFARNVMRSGRPVFVPQVPQRDVRRSVGPEQHQHLVRGSCFSLISVPVAADGRVDGVLLVMRDEPGRPYERDDVDFVDAVAKRVSRALARAEACRAAWDLRRRTVDAIASVVEADDHVDAVPALALDDILAAVTAADPQAAVAVLDLGLRHLACTKPYAALLGHDPTDVLCTPLGAFVSDEQRLQRAFERVLTSELDYRTVGVEPLAGPAPVLLHIAMTRRTDATPSSIVVVAQIVSVPAPAIVPAAPVSGLPASHPTR